MLKLLYFLRVTLLDGNAMWEEMFISSFDLVGMIRRMGKGRNRKKGLTSTTLFSQNLLT